jgi:beta-fructofuranosidase
MDKSSIKQMAGERVRLAGDRYRPLYHFLAPSNWMNDPNGTIFWKGRYHVFYQYNPNGPFHGTIHWGHASSADLVHWQDHPIALFPGPQPADSEQCYSGAAFVNKEGVPTFIYHGLPDGICLATSRDDLLEKWDKHPANPIIPNPGPGDEYQVRGAPCAWVEDGVYYAVTGNSINAPDTGYLFRSSDMSKWEYLHVFYSGGFFTEGASEDCGCPDFFRLGDKHVLLFTSHRRGAQCYTGSYKDQRFVPEKHTRLAFGDWGRPGIYCEGLTLLDDRNRRILFGRIHEARFSHVQRASGWAGIFALPTVMNLAPDGEVGVEPVPELDALRGEHFAVSNVPLAADSVVPLGITGDCLEIKARLEWTDAEEVGLKVRCSEDDSEETLVRFNINPWHAHRRGPGFRMAAMRTLILDIGRSSVSREVCNRDPQHCFFMLPDTQSIELRIYIDRSVVEVFALGRHYLAKRIYPSRPDSVQVKAYAVGGRAQVARLDAWRMKPVWPTV